MNEELMSEDLTGKEEQEPEVEQAGPISDEVLDVVSGGAPPPDGWSPNISWT